MWKSKKSEEEIETYAAQRVEQPGRIFEERKPMEPRLDPKLVPAKEEIINIGRSIFVKGELTGDEDLTIEGRVEGKIELTDHNLVIGPHGAIKGQLNAKNLTVKGRVVGNVFATELVEIKASGSIVGDIKSSRISIAAGGYFKGSVDLRKSADTRERFQPHAPEPAKVNSKEHSLTELHTI